MRTAPLKYHGPGWFIGLANEDEFYVWAPTDDRHFWQVSWDTDNGQQGNCMRGATLTEALKALDDYRDRKVAGLVEKAFREAAAAFPGAS